MPAEVGWKSADVIRALAVILGQSEMHVLHCTRRLSKSGSGLWPTPGKGRRNGFVEIGHLANLLAMFFAVGSIPGAGPINAPWAVSAFGERDASILEDALRSPESLTGDLVLRYEESEAALFAHQVVLRPEFFRQIMAALR